MVERDTDMRQAAFDQVRRLMTLRDPLTSEDLAGGFPFEGERIPLVNPQRGIFKPRAMQFLLSIRTVFPRSGARVWYDDQREVHGQIYRGDASVEYAFMGDDPEAADNRWLRDAAENSIPILYFLGVAPGRYHVHLPVFVTGWDRGALRAQLTFGIGDSAGVRPPETDLERRYALRQVKRRLHQAQFRQAVLAAYDGRCALSRFPDSRLLNAAHIVEDRHEDLGQPIVPNGLPLSKIHHAAFDAHLIGIDADYRLHISEALLAQNDGPVLESIKALNGQLIHLPRRDKDRPDKDRLAQRFEVFRSVA